MIQSCPRTVTTILHKKGRSERFCGVAYDVVDHRNKSLQKICVLLRLFIGKIRKTKFQFVVSRTYDNLLMLREVKLKLTQVKSKFLTDRSNLSPRIFSHFRKWLNCKFLISSKTILHQINCCTFSYDHIIKCQMSKCGFHPIHPLRIKYTGGIVIKIPIGPRTILKYEEMSDRTYSETTDSGIEISEIIDNEFGFHKVHHGKTSRIIRVVTIFHLVHVGHSVTIGVGEVSRIGFQLLGWGSWVNRKHRSGNESTKCHYIINISHLSFPFIKGLFL